MSIQSRNHKWAYLILTISFGLTAHFESHSQSVNRSKSSSPEFLINLESVDWIHGSPDCESARDDPNYQEWQQVQYLASSYVFRQNKCSNYEGPFVYLFVGLERGILIDTGATTDGGSKLLELVRNLTNLPVIVAHTHGHNDHHLGDRAFKTAEGTSVVDVGQSSVKSYFGFQNWPNETITIELGGREIELLPIPGHNNDDLAFYDSLSEIVITGDSLYPGRLYVRDWAEYSESIGRLADWIESRSVTHVLGTHIEMSTTPDTDYPIGTTFQPEEHQLPLNTTDIFILRDAMEEHETPERIPLESFIVWPI